MGMPPRRHDISHAVNLVVMLSVTIGAGKLSRSVKSRTVWPRPGGAHVGGQTSIENKEWTPRLLSVRIADSPRQLAPSRVLRPVSRDRPQGGRPR